jgi:hypothetical protein
MKGNRSRITFAAATLGLLAFLFATLPVSGCGNGTEPERSDCDRLSFSSRAEIGIDFDQPCSSFESTLSNITYDQFGRVISYNFDIRCTTTSERYTGRVYNIEYNNLGVALSWDVTIGGETCHF